MSKPCPNCGFVNSKKVYLEGFDLFWKNYPRKIGKGQAEKVWSHLKPTFELYSIILEAVELQKKGVGWLQNDGMYIPHPSTWLNQKRWLDETQKAKVVPLYDPLKMEARKEELKQIAERDYQRRLKIVENNP